MSESVAVDDATQGAAKTSDAQEDLDTLLNEFDKGTSQPAEKAEPGGQVDTVSRDEFNELQKTIVDQQYKVDIQGVVKQIKGEVDIPYVTDEFVETYLNTEANKNPKLAQAWGNRRSDPEAFKKVIESISKTFQSGFNIDQKITSDMDSVTAAVRSASTKSPETAQEIDWANLSDAEFVQEKAKLKRK